MHDSFRTTGAVQDGLHRISDRGRLGSRHRRPPLVATARRPGVAFICLFALLLAGCGGDSARDGGTGGGDAASPSRSGVSNGTGGGDSSPARVQPSRCPSGHPACRTTEGRIVYVERVDPDGDGDAHFVVLDSAGITLPGLTAIDVRKGLRPQPLPGVGELISAAGPVQTGSYGQHQIHALELHVAH
jgi:hypothetical protein